MDENLENVLDRCIQALRAGDSLADCLARYPEHATELAPLLESAQEPSVAASWELPPGSWAHHRPKISAAMRDLPAKRPWWALLSRVPLSGQARTFAGAAVGGLLLFVVLVATSQPGDFPYRLSLLFEQVPIWFAADHNARSVAELHYADQRLTDLRTQLITTGMVDLAALQALLDADEVAVQDSAGLGLAAEERTATRIMDHASSLLQLSQTANEQRASDTLHHAAEQLLQSVSMARAPVHDQ